MRRNEKLYKWRVIVCRQILLFTSFLLFFLPFPSLPPFFLPSLQLLYIMLKGIFSIYFFFHLFGQCMQNSSLCSSVSKDSACSAGDLRFDPWVRKIPWRRKWQPTPVSLPGKSHGQGGLVGGGLWGCKWSCTTEWLTLTYYAKFLLDRAPLTTENLKQQ